jgi:uncharacterized NAD-dependent epimerase/dehydratase family protein
MERDRSRNFFSFGAYTGKDIKVAVVDSGIDPSHPDIGGIEGGVRISLDEKGEIVLGQDGSDAVGHGTACAGIIRKKAPGIRLYSVKIFDDQALSAEGKVLVEAIRWCVDNGMHVVNLSLGTTRRNLISRLKGGCDYAQEKRVMIVSAEHNEGVESFPASFANVFGVTAGQVYEKYAYLYRENHSIEFVARGDPQRVCWLNPRNIFMGGTSFAAPHISALIALILERYPQADFNQVKKILITNRSQKKIRHSHRGRNAMRESQSGACFTEAPSDSGSKKPDWIRRAAIYPFNKEMHALVRFRDLLKFEVVGVGDPIGKRLVGKDSGEAIGAEPSGIVITHKLDQLLEDADTLILGYVDQLSRILRRDVLGEILEKTIGLGKHIYSLAPIDRSAYAEVFEKARQRRVRVAFPFVSSEELERIPSEQLFNSKSIDVPVVGVFGTSPEQGKFTTQLALRRMLLAKGYTVAQVGSEHQSELFGFDLTFPYGYASAVGIPMSAWVPYLDYNIRDICQSGRPDMVIVGAQSGTIPYDFSASPLISYTLPSLAFLFGTKPDAYILTVNSIDPDEYIQDSINALKALGKGKTILLTMSDKEKDIRSAYGITRVVPRQMPPEEMKVKLAHLEDRFCIPATEVVSEEGQEKLAGTVIHYFAEES